MAGGHRSQRLGHHDEVSRLVFFGRLRRFCLCLADAVLCFFFFFLSFSSWVLLKGEEPGYMFFFFFFCEVVVLQGFIVF